MRGTTYDLGAFLPSLISVTLVTAQNSGDYKEGEIIVHGTASAIDILNERFGGRTVQTYNNFSNIFVIELPEGMSVPEGIEKYESSDVVLYTQPNYIYSITLPGADDTSQNRAPKANEVTQPEMVYFLVGDLSRYPEGESYVLPIPAKQTKKIEHARALIDPGPSETPRAIVSAQIAKGSAGINRDYLAEGKPFWSWHVEKFEFVDITAEIYDGRPSMVNNAWVEKLEYVGFWDYSVVGEIEEPFIDVHIHKNNSNRIELSWPDLGVNYAYWLEQTKSLDDPDWSLVKPTAWPLTQTIFLIDTRESAADNYFRLRTKKRDNP